MKVKFLIVLLVVAFAAFVGYLMSLDAGYFLFSWMGHTIQTSIWLAIGVIILLAVIVHYSFKLLRGLMGIGSSISDWQENRKRTRSQNLTSRGLLYLQEGDYARAEKFLISGAEDHLFPVYNFIGAARSADLKGDAEGREAYLRKALEIDSKAQQAVDVAAAELAFNRGDWQHCLQKLAAVKSNAAVLNLKWRALYHLKSWADLLQLLPQIKQGLPAEEKQRLEAEAVAGLIESSSPEELKTIYKKASTETKNNAEVVSAYIEALGDEKEAETLLRSSLNKHWQPQLLRQYAGLGEVTRAKRIKTCEGWKKQHADDAELHFALGLLYEAQGEKEKAKAEYEKSVQNAHAGASEQLAGLLAFEGDYQQSNELLRLSMKGSQ